jgi:hypothetical protein
MIPGKLARLDKDQELWRNEAVCRENRARYCAVVLKKPDDDSGRPENQDYEFRHQRHTPAK